MFDGIDTILKDVQEDIYKFLSNFLRDPVRRPKKLKELNYYHQLAFGYDRIFWGSRSFNFERNDQDVLNFVSDFLTWLEKKKIEGAEPWHNDGKGLDPDLKEFLQILIKYFFTRLVLSGKDDEHIFGQEKVSYLLRKFAEITARFVISNIPDDQITDIRLELHPANKKQLKSIDGFVSWLFIERRPNNPTNYTLHILYNEQLIQDQNNANKVFESAFLHEFGHIRKQLKWYIEQFSIAQEERVESMPKHEYEAWAYCLLFQACVKSIRSRITRLLWNRDQEWIC